MMEGAREHSSPLFEIPIRCKFECPSSPHAGQTRVEFRLSGLDVVDLRKDWYIGSMYSAKGSLTLICTDETELAAELEEDLAGILDRHSIVVSGDPFWMPPAWSFQYGVSLYVEIVEAWVESGATGSTEFKIPIEATVIFRAALEDDTDWTTLWQEEFRGTDERSIWYSSSPHHAESLKRAYCEAIRSFEAAIGSAEFLGAIRR